ncbi:hypothetical protein ACP4OV_027201 [Aristida adscensionis]
MEPPAPTTILRKLNKRGFQAGPWGSTLPTTSMNHTSGDNPRDRVDLKSPRVQALGIKCCHTQNPHQAQGWTIVVCAAGLARQEDGEASPAMAVHLRVITVARRLS